MTLNIPWLDETNPHEPFPSIETALKDPEGLLAVGGCLSPERLLNAYRNGIFPWFNDEQPILWWSPDPRAVFRTDEIKISRSLRKTLNHGRFSVSVDTNFEAVIRACAAPRAYASGTWITEDMIQAYCRLHALGHAHSVEVRNPDGQLTGGLYGILLDTMFCGESMFCTETDMSKVALVYLASWLREKNIAVIDCQLPNPHLVSLGATPMDKKTFKQTCLTLNR